MALEGCAGEGTQVNPLVCGGSMVSTLLVYVQDTELLTLGQESETLLCFICSASPDSKSPRSGLPGVRAEGVKWDHDRLVGHEINLAEDREQPFFK